MIRHYIYIALFVIGFFWKLYDLFIINKRNENKRERQLVMENDLLMLIIFLYLIIENVEFIIQ